MKVDAPTLAMVPGSSAGYILIGGSSLNGVDVYDTAVSARFGHSHRGASLASSEVRNFSARSRPSTWLGLDCLASCDFAGWQMTGVGLAVHCRAWGSAMFGFRKVLIGPRKAAHALTTAAGQVGPNRKLLLLSSDSRKLHQTFHTNCRDTISTHS